MTMDRAELAAMLGRVKQATEQRIEIWRQVVDGQGNKSDLIYRGTFVLKDEKPRTEGA